MDFYKNLIFHFIFAPTAARVVELVDTLSSGGSAARCGGSNPLARTTKPDLGIVSGFFVVNLTKVERVCIYFIT